MKQSKTLKLCLGLFIAVCAAIFASPVSAQTLIPLGADWKYLDDGTDQATAWRGAAFDDAAWESGAAELGFGETGEATLITSGNITYYFRHAFTVANASSITNLRASVKRDDGVVVYLNGTEVWRNNMPEGTIGFDTMATAAAGDDGQNFHPARIDASLLMDGENVLAVEVHQNATTSSDVSFDLSLTANPLPTIVFSTPTNGQVIASSSVGISGTATPAGDSVSLVEVFVDNNKVGESTNSNFSVVWQNAALGSHQVRATVRDSSGLVGTSAVVNVTVQEPPAGVLIPRRSVWRFHDRGEDLGTAWTAISYDDGGWGSGPGPLGGGDAHQVTLVNYGAAGARFPGVYYRKTINVSNASAYQGLILRLMRDDGAAVFLNGQLLVADGVAEPVTYSHATQVMDGANETTYVEHRVPASALVDGENVFAVFNAQANVTSSDLTFDLEVEGDIDTSAPTVTGASPSRGVTVLELPFISVFFSEGVVGVTAGDLVINGEPATSVVTNNPNDYTFHFPSPGTGRVEVAFSANHGITDSSPLANAFLGASWIYTLDPDAAGRADIVISEFLAGNDRGIRDEDGNRSDWIELHNRGPLEVNLAGWYLTDSETNLTKWRFPEVIIGPNNYLIVWASNQDRTNSNNPLHTNFRLGKEPGYLALVSPRPQTNIVSFFDNYPAQTDDISYGRDSVDANVIGYFPTPTPGAANSGSGTGFATAPVFSVGTGVYTNNSLSITLTAGPGEVIRYTLNGRIPDNSSTQYTGAIIISTNVTITARSFSSTAGILPSAVVGHTYLFLDGTTREFTSNLPVLIFDTRGQAIPVNVPPGQPRAKGAISIYEPNVGGRTVLKGTPQFQGVADYEVFGQSSQGFPQRPIRFEIQDAAGNDLDVPVLGFPADSDWRVRSTYNDKTLMNDFLAFTMFEEMGHYSVRRELVEVFVDTGGGRLTYGSDYYGVMCLAETIKVNNDRVDIARLSPNTTDTNLITGGYIFKKDKDGPGDLNFTTTGGGGHVAQGIKMHEPKPNELRTGGLSGGLTAAGQAQVNYLRGYLNDMERALYSSSWLTATGTNHYSHYLDVDSMVDQFWIVEFPKQIDGYRISNYYYKDRGGKVVAGPIWDWNLAFGNANYLQGGWTNGWYYELLDDWAHMGWARRLITGSPSAVANGGDPDYVQKIADRWAELRLDIMNGTNFVRRVDSLSSELAEAAQRHWTRWGMSGLNTWPLPNKTGDGRDVDYVQPPDYRGSIQNSIIGQMQNYMFGRYLWIDSQFAKTPGMTVPSGQVTNGTVVMLTAEPGATLYYTLDGTDPRMPGGAIRPGVFTNSSGGASVTVNSDVKIFARARRSGTFKNTWSGPATGSFFTEVPGLRIVEIMFNPVPPVGSSFGQSELEYIKVKNVGSTALSLFGYKIGGGVNFDFPNETLASGESAVVVSSTNGFQSLHGASIRILGQYVGNLSNAGEEIYLLGPLDQQFLTIDFNDRWAPTADGLGFSMVAVDENAAPSAFNTSLNWRGSTTRGGSPGAPDPAPVGRGNVVINEVLTHTDVPQVDAIELHNIGTTPVDVSGWFISDDRSNPFKFQIPAGTPALAAGGFLVFDESEFGTNTLGTNFGFALNSTGDETWVFSAQSSNLTGYAHGFDFGAAANGVSFGRHVTSTGADQFIPQLSVTLGAANSGPRIGPVVISEIAAAPVNAGSGFPGVGLNNEVDEFVELQNISNQSVALFDSSNPSNTWRLTEGVEFQFPRNVTLPAGGFTLVVSFDPATNAANVSAFRSRNEVPSNTPIYGPYVGLLNNDGETVELRRPDAPGTNGVTPYIMVERINYENRAPWPFDDRGLGLSLQRTPATAYGNDPANWEVGVPSPGGNFAPGTPPVITRQPESRLALEGGSVVLAPQVSSATPLRYQWRFQGVAIPNAVGSLLTLNNIQLNQAGNYDLVVYNSGGVAVSDIASIVVRSPLRITTQPTNWVAKTGPTNLTFVVEAEGTGTLTYQWRLNGTNIAGANTNFYRITNVQSTNIGTYDVVITDTWNIGGFTGTDTLISAPATLSIIAVPVFVFHPLSQTVVEGSSVTIAVFARGSTPMYFRWRTNGGNAYLPFSEGITTPTGAYQIVTFHNVRASAPADVSVVVSNIASPGVLSQRAVLTVLADTDRDGIPDSVEGATNIDAAADADGDGATNGEEYIAGTDMNNAASVLEIQAPTDESLSFTAVSNRTYTVQFSEDLVSGWQKLSDVFAMRTNRVVDISDQMTSSNRFYRLVIPAQP